MGWRVVRMRYAWASLFLATAPCLAHALLITEIMYNPPGSDSSREWIEVLNNGTSSVALSDLRLRDGKGNHKIVSVWGATVVAPGAYAVIARDAAAFEASYGRVPASLFRSSFSLNNTGGVIAVSDSKGHALDTAPYDSAQGAAGDGNTLNHGAAGDQLTARAPSPGAAVSPSSIAPPVKRESSSIVSHSSPRKIKQTTPRADSNVRHPMSYISHDSDTADVPTNPMLTQAAAVSSSPDRKWLLALFALIALPIAAVFSARHFAKREWDIVEETGE